MKKVTSKLIVLVVALAAAIGGVLFFVQYMVSPPADISAEATPEEVFNPSLKDTVAAFSPDTLTLKEAEVAYDALVDRATVFLDDTLITDESVYDDAIEKSSEKFSQAFITWAYDKFSEPVWNTRDHEAMLRLIAKMRGVSVNDGAKKALSQQSLSSLTEIEKVINDYQKAWNIAKSTSFTDYQSASYLRSQASVYLDDKYLRNCTSLVGALKALGSKLEQSRYNQLYSTVGRLQHLYNFKSKEAYDTESKRIYGLIKAFKDTKAFGISTVAHAKILADMQDRYDRAAEDHEWAVEIEVPDPSENQNEDETL